MLSELTRANRSRDLVFDFLHGIELPDDEENEVAGMTIPT